MAPQIRIDALARQCGVAPREVLRVLIELGHFRYTRFNQQVPFDLAEQVRGVFASSADADADADARPAAQVDAFAQAMSAAGVKPLASRGLGERAKRGRGAARPRPVTSPEVEPEPARTVASVEPQPEPEPIEPVQTATDVRGGALQARIVQLEARVLELERSLVRAERDHRAAVQLHTTITAERDELQQLSRSLAERDQGGVGVRLVDLLQSRGLKGVDEAGFTLRALLAAHLLDRSLPFFHVQDGPRLQRLLRDRLCLRCADDRCATPEGVEVVRVPSQRCEVCGGHDLAEVMGRFSDACLLAGINRVLLVGGRRWFHGLLERGVDRRVQLRAWSGEQPLASERLGRDLDWARVAVVWDDGSLGSELAGAVKVRLDQACLEVKASSVGEALHGAAGAVDGLDISVLDWG